MASLLVGGVASPALAATNPAVIPVPQRGMEARHAAKAAAASQHAYDLLLIGDSITHNLDKPEYREVWATFYAPRNALNLGYSGARTENILWNLSHGELSGQTPKVAVLLIGTNNSDDANYPQVSSPEQIAEGTEAIVQLIRAASPQTKVLVLRIFPRQNYYFKADHTERGSMRQRDEINRRAGELVAKLADNQSVFFLDVNRIFLRSDGTIDPRLMPDLLHPSPLGARQWAEAMEPMLAKLFGDTPHSDPAGLASP